jgi:hypothetical protein
MYSLASLRLSLAADFAPLEAIAQAMVWVSVAVWAATFVGMLVAGWRSYRDFRVG